MRRSALILVLAVIIPIVTFAQNDELDVASVSLAGWQKELAVKTPKSVLDYYLLLPEQVATGELYGGVKDSKEFRTKQMVLNDAKNGYLEAPGLTVAVFKDKVKGRDVVAVIMGCGEPPIQYCNQYFLEFDGSSGKWKDVRNVFPWDTISKMAESKKADYFFIELPRYGTVAEVKMIDGDGVSSLLCKTGWVNGSFSVVR